VISHRQRLGKAFGFVVYTARADSIHMPDVRFPLGVFQWIAVDLRGGGKQETGALLHCQAKRIVGSQRANLESLDRKAQIVDGAGRRRKVQHSI